MANHSKDESPDMVIAREIQLYSNEAFNVAKLFVTGDDPEPLIQQAAELKSRMPAVAARIQETDPEYHEHLKRTLSEARLDLDYVIAGGGRPSSIRLGRLIHAGTAP